MMAVSLFGDPVVASPRECTLVRVYSLALCRQLIAQWHSLLPHTPAGFRLAFIAYAPNGEPVACALWGRPVARNEDQVSTLELTRLAHSPCAPRNMGSWMLGQMRKYIRENMPEIKRLISYQDADHHLGTIYKADNWRIVYEKHGEAPWTGRVGRRTGSERMHKIKWEREP